MIALPLVLAMLFVSLAPFAVVPAKATALDNNITGPTIYYFNDYYPSISKDAMESTYPGYNVVYYHEWVTEATLYNTIMQGFPSDANVHTVIIDIKSFKPSGAVLNSIFSYFASQGYRTVFVTPYDQAEFTSQEFTQLLELYYRTGIDALDIVVDEYLDDVIPEMFDENLSMLNVNHTIVIDGRLLELGDIHALNVHERIANSPFMKRLIEALAARGEITTTDYYGIIEILKDDFGIDILVHVGGDEFISLADCVTHEVANISELGDNVSVFAFWSLTEDMETLIEQEDGNYPVHVMEAEPVVYSEDGLCVTVHSAGGSDEEAELLAMLRNILQ